MGLRPYHQKRNFTKTTEPKGNPSYIKKSKLIFVVQKHHASHLHYDFRLELKGVLLSWAVPKGPSLDPTIKRLAIQVEDHPIEYASFAGIIPKGEYGAGTVMIWDKGTWSCEGQEPVAAYQKGHLVFYLHGKKLRGKWALVRTKINAKSWLLMKMRDPYAKPEKEKPKN